MCDTVLLVDDQAYSFTNLADWLKRYDLRLAKAIDVRQGLERAAELHANHQLGLLLLDIIMKTGGAVADSTGGREAGVLMGEELRRRGIDEPIIFYSVVTDEALRSRAEAVPNAVFVHKIPPRQMAQRIGQQLKRGQTR